MHAGHRAHAHIRRGDPYGAAAQPFSLWLQIVLPEKFLRNEQQGCRAVVDAGGVSRSYGSVLLKGGTKLAKGFKGCIASDVFVIFEQIRSFAGQRYLNRNDLLAESAGALRFVRLLL
ncbi:hypothetical protein SDC9_152928 [bioreactor metagenome]|uniref:Uncharacterized protein n=1 Tax=bioreactor metagenome TaxID=1076179 RepID=A0A645EV01_9ZZZZ